MYIKHNMVSRSNDEEKGRTAVNHKILHKRKRMDHE